MLSAGLAHAAIGRAAYDAGLSLTPEQVQHIVEAEGACLAERGRIVFGEGTAVRLVREFASSPYASGCDTERIFRELLEVFYELRDDLPASVTDAEIVEALRDSFDGEAAGDVRLALEMAKEPLCARSALDTYVISDAEGKTYHWDPGDWDEDVRANGWLGERWGDSGE